MTYSTTDSIQPQSNKSTIAPTEKHLEDWICANFYRFGGLVEQEIVPEYAREGCYCPDDTYYVDTFFSHLIARQLSLPAGRPDLLAYRFGQVAAIEMKKGAITYDVIGQCLRYVHDLKQIFSWVFYDTFSDPDSDAYVYRKPQKIDLDHYIDDEIFGVVVGHSIQDKNIPLVCAASGIMCVTYEFTGDEYLFNHVDLDAPHHDYYRQHVDQRAGQFMRLAMKDRSTRQREIDERSKGLEE